MTICPGFKPHGVPCPLRRDCKFYNNLLQMAVEHVNIKLAKESRLVNEIEVKFTTTGGKDKCINFEKE